MSSKKARKPLEDGTVADDTTKEEARYKLVNKRIVKGKTQYFLKWAGFDESVYTWEKEENLARSEIIKFELNYRKKNAAQSAKKKPPTKKKNEKKPAKSIERCEIKKEPSASTSDQASTSYTNITTASNSYGYEPFTSFDGSSLLDFNYINQTLNRNPTLAPKSDSNTSPTSNPAPTLPPAATWNAAATSDYDFGGPLPLLYTSEAEWRRNNLLDEEDMMLGSAEDFCTAPDPNCDCSECKN